MDALLNPLSPMAFFTGPSWMATRTMNQTYASVGSLAVLLWDIILHSPQDYKIARRYGINISFIIYCIARLTTLTYFTFFVVFITAPVGDCNIIHQFSILYPFTIPLTILPLVLRVFALYKNNPFVVAFFSMTWLSVLGSCIAVSIGAFGYNVGSSKYCLDNKTKMANGMALFCPFIHDTLIFVATSWALMKFSYSEVNFKNGISVMLRGNHLPAFSKSILRNGQFYYLVTLILNLFFIVLFYIPAPPLILPCTIGSIVFVLLNTMSSYVYRNMRLGSYQDYSITSSAINRAVQGPVRQTAIRFERPKSTKDLEVGRDMEDGENNAQQKVDEFVESTASGSRNSVVDVVDQTEKGNV